MDTRPIGMFDSGCGGLTVLKEYIKKLPNEDFIYYGDTAHLPYGDKSKEKIIEYAEEITKFLIKKEVKMIIIACGTASASAYHYLKEKYPNIPIKNIIEPTAKLVTDEHIGVIATKATIKSKAWEHSILKYNPTAKIKSIACPLLVPLIEEGFIDNPATDFILNDYLKIFLNDLDSSKTPNISSLILGCTHYPILKSHIQNILSNSVNVINVGTCSANDTASFLQQNSLQNDINHQGMLEFHSSDDFESFKENAKLLGFAL
ncbi:MAG: glutamate racemase [Clostridia bacterium]|nr:glutamate racemase [Clostridia bacterium]